jgi:hypothetical protein
MEPYQCLCRTREEEYIMKVSQSKTGVKFDSSKTRYDLLPASPLEQVARIYTFGANKYSDRNWEKGMKWSRVFAACMRHMWAFWRGEDIDPESGQSHLAHAAFNVLALLEYTETQRVYDDRPKRRLKK